MKYTIQHDILVADSLCPEFSTLHALFIFKQFGTFHSGLLSKLHPELLVMKCSVRKTTMIDKIGVIDLKQMMWGSRSVCVYVSSLQPIVWTFVPFNRLIKEEVMLIVRLRGFIKIWLNLTRNSVWLYLDQVFNIGRVIGHFISI